jgi:putative DNA primase/helicase
MSALQFSLREIAHRLGGSVAAGQVVAPGPSHSRSDRSMTVRLSPTARDGFVVYSHAGDDFGVCKDYVRECLGMRREDRREAIAVAPTMPTASTGTTTTADALALWDASVDPCGSIVERYLASRALVLGDDIAGDVLRWNPHIGAVIALFREIATGEPQAVSRIFLDREGRKRERKFLGPVGGAAVMLDPFDAVTNSLHLAEGVETSMAARQLGLRPVWALGSAGAIAAFPVLSGIECLTLLVEHDDASAKAVRACGARWHAAGREVLINRPIGGKDLNDALRAAP